MNITPQQAYDGACAQYAKAKNLISELSDLCKRVASSFSYEIALAQFDIILQCVLFRAAIADQKIYENEKIFIRDITERADLMMLINKAAGTGFSWDHLPLFTPDQQKKFSDALEGILDKYTTEFVIPFAKMDTDDTARDYLKELDTIVAHISVYFSFVDGEALKQESEAAADAYSMLHAKWKYCVQEFSKKK